MEKLIGRTVINKGDMANNEKNGLIVSVRTNEITKSELIKIQWDNGTEDEFFEHQIKDNREAGRIYLSNLYN